MPICHHSRPGSFVAECETSAASQSSKRDCYTVGQLLNPLFYLYRCLYLPGNRGPFWTSRESMAAKIDFPKTWGQTCYLIKSSTKRDDSDKHDGWDSDFEDEASRIKKLCYGYRTSCPRSFRLRQTVHPRSYMITT